MRKVSMCVEMIQSIISSREQIQWQDMSPERWQLDEQPIYNMKPCLHNHTSSTNNSYYKFRVMLMYLESIRNNEVDHTLLNAQSRPISYIWKPLYLNFWSIPGHTQSWCRNHLSNPLVYEKLLLYSSLLVSHNRGNWKVGYIISSWWLVF